MRCSYFAGSLADNCVGVHVFSVFTSLLRRYKHPLSFVSKFVTSTVIILFHQAEG